LLSPLSASEDQTRCTELTNKAVTLTLVTVTAAAAGSNGCISHCVFADEAQQLIRKGIGGGGGGGQLLWHKGRLLLLASGVSFPAGRGGWGGQGVRKQEKS